ncbi:MAG: phosphoenolpyruvate carboxykinase (ATP) [Deltaproteobacteria bacterium]|nr:phosphoenolpyruvate carboxykinase (ATP) [Deltaproteobacteria bacterium]
MTTYGLETLGLHPQKTVMRNLAPEKLVALALERGEGELAANEALVVRTGSRTGRSPKDRFVVEDATTKPEIWWGKVNHPVSPENFERQWQRAMQYLSQKDLFVFDGFAGADKDYRLPVRVVTEKAWHSLFARTLFLRPTEAELAKHRAEFTVVSACGLKAEAGKDGALSEVFVGMDFVGKRILILGTEYGGEMKKAIFAVMNYLLPKRNAFPMHCSANVGPSGDTALFFGLSGTGKTTLSADTRRRLIGDDEHGWTEKGVFNFEGGCYAKVIKLSKEAEPQIWNAIRPGSVLENVVMDPKTKVVDYNSEAITENTRATYPVDYIPNCILEGVGGHPKNIFFLACDAYGVLPPIAKLTPEMAMFHFLSGYTAKVAGTEAGITEPKATFSACFGDPFLPLHPTTYAKLLGEKLRQSKANCWLVNTGWSGGPYGVGKRMKIQVTRALLDAALAGKLEQVATTPHEVFQILIPNACPGVDTELLHTRNTWNDKAAYDAKAKELAGMFRKNFEQFATTAGNAVVAAGPLA